MFSILNKDGELGMRFGKEVRERHIEEFGASKFYSYNSEMHGYERITDGMFDDLDRLAEYLNKSIDYVLSLEPK